MSRKNRSNQRVFIQILEKYRTGTADPEEVATVERWYTEFEDQPGYTDHMSAPEKEIVKQRLFAKLNSQTRPHPFFQTWMPYAAAALAFIFLTLGIGYFMRNENNPITAERKAKDVLPGGSRALLTLSDGRQIALDEKQSEINAGTDLRYGDGSTVLNDVAPKNTKDAFPLGMNQLNTPKGGIYQLVLPDGSKAWLNSASSISYPSRFDHERLVRITGEVYFEIAKKMDAQQRKIPFVVQTPQQTIEVTGTQFNVSAYPEDGNEATTLVEGSVNISNQHSKKALSPGQQAYIAHNSLRVRAVNVNQFIAWKSGYFDFTDMNISDVMKQVARWYDLQVIYEGEIPKIEFFGSIERKSNLAVVLALLETNNIAYTLKGKTIYIAYKKTEANMQKK